MKLAKGTRVLVKATARASYIYNRNSTEGLAYYPNDMQVPNQLGYLVHGNPKGIWRTILSKPWHGIVIGWTHRVYGYGYPITPVYGEDYPDPACLIESGRIMGYMVERLDFDRYRVPEFCLPEDLEEEICASNSTT